MFKDVKTLLTPPFTSKDLYSIFIIVFIMVSIPLTVLQTSIGQNSLQSNAATNTSKSTTSVEILSPGSNETVSGTTTVKLTSESDFQIISMSLLVNGRVSTTINNSLPSKSYSGSVVWDTTKETNGGKTLVAESLDNSGQVTKSDSITITVGNVDQQAPSISFNQPIDGAYISNSANYSVKLTATDNNSVSHVLVMLDDNLIKNFTSGPYEFSWDVKNLQPGTHVLSATAFDLAGNETTTKIQVYIGVKNLNL